MAGEKVLPYFHRSGPSQGVASKFIRVVSAVAPGLVVLGISNETQIQQPIVSSKCVGECCIEFDWFMVAYAVSAVQKKGLDALAAMALVAWGVHQNYGGRGTLAFDSMLGSTFDSTLLLRPRERCDARPDQAPLLR